MDMKPLLIEACEVYLRTDSQHKHGFCAWATDYLWDQYSAYYSAYYVYNIVGSFLKTQGGADDGYAAPLPGRHPLRTEFVRKLRNYLKENTECS